jgi:hypothetical protein
VQLYYILHVRIFPLQLTCSVPEKTSLGDNVLIFAQMAHYRQLGKRVVLLRTLNPLHQNALVVAVLFIVNLEL